MDSEILENLKSIVGLRFCSTRAADLFVYGFDASIHHAAPDVVVQPQTTEQVSSVVKLANKHLIPVTPRGAGTGLCGAAVPLRGGIVVDMTRMHRIKDIKVEDLYCVVEPGVVYDNLNAALAPYRFMFPPSPGSGEACTIGGMVALNSSGMRAVKYGATRDYVLALEVVLPSGKIMRIGTRTLKNSSGYQLERLFVGSEGTLGIITEVTLRVMAKPQKNAMVIAGFDSVERAGRCVSALIAEPLLPSAIELMDSICIKAVNKAVNAGLPDTEALCMIEVDGPLKVVDKEMNQVKDICEKVGAVGIQESDDLAQMSKWTNARKSINPALSRFCAGLVSVALADDMAVPISKVPQAVVAFGEIARRNHVIVVTYGHASDGNLHTKMFVNPESAESWKSGEQVVKEIYDAVLSFGGTVTGEHGVGISKAPYFMKERESAIDTMIRIKKAIDPNNIMNPGKMMSWKGSIISHLRYPCKEFCD